MNEGNHIAAQTVGPHRLGDREIFRVGHGAGKRGEVWQKAKYESKTYSAIVPLKTLF